VQGGIICRRTGHYLPGDVQSRANFHFHGHAAAEELISGYPIRYDLLCAGRNHD
jgi:hypothetical protein